MRDEEVERRVFEALAPHDTRELVVEVKGGVVRLSGLIGSEQSRREITEAIAATEGVKQVRNELRVETALAEGSPGEPPAEITLGGDTGGGEGAGWGLGVGFNEPLGTTDVTRAAEEAEPFVPPTDPVIRPAPSAEEGVEVVGGFSGTSMDPGDEEVDHRTDVERGDEAIADDIRRELREDSLTADLEVHVFVRRGVVHLRGSVASLDDAEAVEEVASRVPGVVEVKEQLEVGA